MFIPQPVESLPDGPSFETPRKALDGPFSKAALSSPERPSSCRSSAVTAAAAAACCLPRRRSVSTMDRSPSQSTDPASPRCPTRGTLIGRSVRRAAAETFQLTSLTVQLLRFLGLGINWMSKFFLLMLYSVLLMPGFLQVMWYYFFSPNVRRSIPYGLLPRNSLDIFVPSAPSAHPRPVVIFITGGAWIIGYKAWGTLLAQALEEQGVIVASIDYRNFPQATVSGMLDDVTRGIGWVLENIDRYGGDPNRVHLAGQSAGAHLSSVAVIRQALMHASSLASQESQESQVVVARDTTACDAESHQEATCVLQQSHGVARSLASEENAVFMAPAAASAKVHPVDAWTPPAAPPATPASASIPIADIRAKEFPEFVNPITISIAEESGVDLRSSAAAAAAVASPGLAASAFSPFPATAVSPPTPSAVTPPARASADIAGKGMAAFRSLSMRRLAYLGGGGGAAEEGSGAATRRLDVWSSRQIKSFIGVSGCYNLVKLAPQFEDRGMNPYLFLSIFEGEQSLPLFSPELLVLRPAFQPAVAASLLPPVHLYHGVDDISVPFTASEDFGAALHKAGVETKVKLYSGKGHIDLTLQDLFRGGRDELVQDILAIVHRQCNSHSHSHSQPHGHGHGHGHGHAHAHAHGHRHISSCSHQSASAMSAPHSEAQAMGMGATSLPSACPASGGPDNAAAWANETPRLSAVLAAAAHAPAQDYGCIVHEADPVASPMAGLDGGVGAQVVQQQQSFGEIDAVLHRPVVQGPERKWMVPEVLLAAAKFVSPF